MNKLTIWQISFEDLYQYFFDSKIHINTKSVRKLLATTHFIIEKYNAMDSM